MLNAFTNFNHNNFDKNSNSLCDKGVQKIFLLTNPLNNKYYFYLYIIHTTHNIVNNAIDESQSWYNQWCSNCQSIYLNLRIS